MSYGISDGGELQEVGGIELNPSGEIVFASSGGWLSGPCLTPDEIQADEDDYAAGPPREYGLNIVALMADYPDFVIIGEQHGNGYKAYLRGARSQAVGSGVWALTLDELAHEMNRVRRRIDGA